MRKIFFIFLISCFIFSVISCRKAGSDGSATSSGGSATSSVGSATSSGDEAPKNVVFSKTILDPDAKLSKDYEESASDVIRTSGGDYVVVGLSLIHISEPTRPY